MKLLQAFVVLSFLGTPSIVGAAPSKTLFFPRDPNPPPAATHEIAQNFDSDEAFTGTGAWKGSPPPPRAAATDDISHVVKRADDPPTGSFNITLPSEREFLLNVPAGYKHGEKHPLVFSFHGANGNKVTQELITGLSDPSLRIDNKPFLAVYGQGVANTTADKTATWLGAPYANTTVDDIAFVHDMIANITSTYNIDSSRIYASGKSNGGGFAALLACRNDTSSLFAAFAPVSPALYEGTMSFHGCQTDRGVPILHSHGVEDQTCPFTGKTPEDGGSGPEEDVRIWRRQWALRNGCVGNYPGQYPVPKVKQVYDGVWEEVWDCPKGEVRALSVEGLGHSWPTTEGLDLSGAPNQTANFNLTSPILVNFFSKHRLP
ncbi:hypothetical protein L202_03208 [Cryptococcus amylolentus CBS 6039]|uniref:feruloyl esterase n=1 Tax=Cryptococcus amylolentus CBS 6039 TaxID=1295533 RepID=A0A1E3HXR1_9TREE|nr:hypothetical protein L202_03208 [Cryptococcus amylolentus CBS 6039]ODN81114.1 hypothetical protein L202_03208 [Cryptococcus amylolentus CBS 6039]